MAFGTTQLFEGGAADLSAVVTELNSFFTSGGRMRVFGRVEPRSSQRTSNLVARILAETMDAAGFASGLQYRATSFAGAQDDVQSDYETFFGVGNNRVPHHLISFTFAGARQVDQMQLLVIYILTTDTDNGARSHLPPQIMLVAPSGNIAAGATGTVDYIQSDGTVLESGLSAVNMSSSDTATSGSPTLGVFDVHTNKVLLMPSCCGSPP